MFDIVLVIIFVVLSAICVIDSYQVMSRKVDAEERELERWFGPPKP
jgi:hypothetical protein